MRFIMTMAYSFVKMQKFKRIGSVYFHTLENIICFSPFNEDDNQFQM